MEPTLLVRGRGDDPPTALFAVAPMLGRLAEVRSDAPVEFERFDSVDPVAVVATELDGRDHAAAREPVDVRRLHLPPLGELLGRHCTCPPRLVLVLAEHRQRVLTHRAPPP